jgi:hypothetical protein
MSHESQEPKSNGINFQRASAYKVSTVNRHSAQVETTRSGRTRTTVEGTEVVLANLSKFPGVTRENMQYWVGADPATETIALYLEADGTDLMKPRDWDTILGFHVGGVYQDHPQLRPNTTLQCDFKFATDAAGKPCFTFNLKAGLPKKRMGIAGGRPEPENKIRRRLKKGESAADVAAANNAKRAARKKSAPPPVVEGDDEE